MSETEAPVPRPPQIHAAIIAAMQAVRAVGKNGHNTDQNFKYRKYDDIITVANAALVEAGVAITPTTVAMEREQRQVTTKTQNRRTVTTTVVHMRYTLTCAADASAVTVDWYGEASDYGDKSLGKALSYSAKMFLIDLLKIPVDDPDADADGASHADDAPADQAPPPQPQRQRQQQQRPPRQQGKPAAATAPPALATVDVVTDQELLDSIIGDLAPFASDPVEAGGNERLKEIWARVDAGTAEGKISREDRRDLARHIKVLKHEIAELAEHARQQLASRNRAAAPAADAPVEDAHPSDDAHADDTVDPWADAPTAAEMRAAAHAEGANADPTAIDPDPEADVQEGGDGAATA